MMGRRIVLAAVLLFLVGPASAAGPLAFAVQLEGGAFKQYRLDKTRTISDDVLDATATDVGGDEVELTVTPKHDAITLVWFPWEPDRVTDAPRVDDAIVYYPRLLGVAVRASLLAEWGWQGGPYPGECYAPLVVVADDADARMVAATNWPPRRVTPMYSLGRIGLRYDARLPVGTQRTYRALLLRASGSTSEPPWQVALDRYRDWLRGRVRAAGLEPSYPAWMRDAHGWLNVQLQNTATWEPARVEVTWQRWKRQLPWVQFWGQMSPYYDRERSRPDEAGCCLDRTDLHPRYEPGLQRLARVVAQDGRVGYYARPRSPYAPLVRSDTDAPTAEYDFLRAWLERNRSRYGANAFYIDVLGGRDFGDPYQIATLLKQRVDAGTVVERAVDVYPTAALMSGALGGGSWQGGPGRTTARLGRDVTRTTFPSFGRALLTDRILFLGESNGDGRWWGPTANYWTERQAFLLGAKFDVMRPTEDGKPNGPENRALALAIAARDRVGWWRRDPEYLDRRGVRGVPADVDVRRYRGRDGEKLLVVDNWTQRRDVRVTVDGQPVAIPADALSIVVVPSPTPG